MGDRITYVHTGANLGFAGGMKNVGGIRRALDGRRPGAARVNSDMVVPPDCIGRLEAAVADRSGAGIAGPLVLSRSVPDIVGSAGIDYNLATGRMRHRGVGSAGPLRGTRPAGEAQTSGCAIERRRRERMPDAHHSRRLRSHRAARRALFFSFEEIDFCLRARAADSHAARRRCRGVSRGRPAIGAHSARRLYFAARNHLMLAQRHANGDGALKRGARSLFVVALNLAHAVRAPGGSLPARMGATLRGIRDIWQAATAPTGRRSSPRTGPSCCARA